MNQELKTVHDWWTAAEQGIPRTDELEEALRRAHDDELNARLDACAATLAGVDVTQLPAVWSHVHELLECRLAVRRGRVEELPRILTRLEELLGRLAEGETSTHARALHIAGVACVRLDRLRAAEELLAEAAQEIGSAPALSWVAESFAQVLQGQGAWEETKLVLSRVLELKRRRNDSLGVAISTGSLARLHKVLREPEEALRVLAGLWRDESLPPITRLRLATLAIESQTKIASAPAELLETTDQVQELLSLVPDHPLGGYANLALAQALHTFGEPLARALGHERGVREAIAGRLDSAGALLSGPDQLAWLAYHRALLLSDDVPGDEWLAEMQELFDNASRKTEAEVRTHLLICERAHAAGLRAKARAHLEAAEAHAIASNNPHWVALAQELGWRVDPEGHGDRVSRRLSGRSLADMLRTERREATILFADLVDFTPRSHALPPEEVMSTVRSLFQLTSQLMGEHGIRPLSYLGDGLLALAEGADHEQRGVRFATEIVARAGRITRMHRVLDIPWGLELRAGVASGPVVVGALGTQYKQEFSAIGLTTNLAARLQAEARPGQVLVAGPTARASGIGGACEELRLKGFPDPVQAVRVVADAPGRAGAPGRPLGEPGTI